MTHAGTRAIRPACARAPMLAGALAGCLVSVAAGCAAPSRPHGETRPHQSSNATDAEPAIAALLDAWHHDAATGDFEGYFAAMTPDAVFIGTDKTERWGGAEFRDFARPYFDGPKAYGEGAWTYEPVSRWIVVDDDRGVAWFEERLMSPAYGVCRGTGVALFEADGAWRIAQYALTFPVPNEIARDVIGLIRTHEGAHEESGSPEPGRADKAGE